MVTGLSANTFNKLQLNAGVLLKDFSYSEITTASALASAIATAAEGTGWIGATRGGAKFDATPETREVEADGMRSAFVGSTIIDNWECKLSATLIEMTPANLQLALGAVDKTTSGAVTKMTLRSEYKSTDYADNICWIGDMAGGGYVLICIKKALAKGGVSFSFTDKGEGEIPIELTAHAADVSSMGTAPCEILMFAPATASSGT